jgi:hypothetical protein
MKLINVRAEIGLSANRVLVTGAITNPMALKALKRQWQGNCRYLRIHDDPEKSRVYDMALEIAREEGSAIEVIFGKSNQYFVEVAGLPKATGELVVGGWPLLDAVREPEPTNDHDELIEELLPPWLVWFTEFSGRLFGRCFGLLYCLIIPTPRLRVVHKEEL